ncbi:PQQ-dependent dehydrogenase, methanol/ethanol family [Alloalcanivorax profundimaris]|uniref:PQQ-dependent dehydrogenase, methanol/ethanol family n=1 Tax=Alloalcanivorax profundimaris TaxID=2735259 RepID=UPI001886E65E|nr:PQQ-dependent dehydrogenase, methanol/ethanol family [Alloalcanivorax profundimaris]MBF1800581.1 PQQ-dependent dehydrogenase, methanol/ethanol family [Alloalcanivorax profundimaris]
MNTSIRAGGAAALAAACLLSACAYFDRAPSDSSSSSRPAADVGAARLAAADGEPGNWMTHGGTYQEQRFSRLDRINQDNVGRLGLAWTYKLDLDRGVEATPIVVDGVMYTTGPFSMVYALDARSGELLWKYDPGVTKTRARDGCCGPVNRGVAVWQGKVYVGAYDGRLIALDAATGEPVWSVDTLIDKNRSYTVTGAPRVVKGKVIIGNGGAEFGVRGYITAYDADTGKQAWRFFTVPGDPAKPPENEAMARARETWFGDQYWKQGGGGTVWDSMAYDPELDLLYIGTGNGSLWNRQARSEGKGDNLYLSSIVALRPDTGEYVWHYQTTPGDQWDFTATQTITLADLEIDGEMRQVLMQAPKNAFYYVLDRRTGELISAEKYAPANWAERVDPATGRPVVNQEVADWTKGPRLLVPGPLGAHNWQPMSFSPDTGLAYIPVQEAPAMMVPDNDATFRGKSRFQVGSEPVALPEDAETLAKTVAAYKGRLVAWDPVAQKEVWRQPFPSIWNGGVLSTAGGLVFQGNVTGTVAAYDAADGDKLWEAPANTGVVAGPVTYEVDGEQYVTFMAGWGGVFPLAFGGLAANAKVRPEARILTYKLDGDATLPEPQRRAVAVPEALPALTADAATVDQGRDLYNDNCGLCHGFSAMGGGVVPDLRYMDGDTHKAFPGIVAGLYQDKGMPSFAGRLTPEQVEAIHQYVIKRAHDLKDSL